MKRWFSIALCLILTAVMVSDAWAKRRGPEAVTPVVSKGIKYVASNKSGREGKVEAWSVEKNEKLWEVVVYTVKIDPGLEEDVQWVFITKLATDGDTLTVTNEKQENYAIDLKTKKVRKVEK